MATTRRLAAALLAAALASAACSSSDDPTDRLAAGPTSAAPTSTGTGPTGSPNGTDDGPPAPTEQSDASTATTAAPPAPAPPGTDQQPSTLGPVPAPGSVGSYAGFYLRPAESERIVLEIRSQSGAEPRERTIRHLQDVLASVSGKEVLLSGGRVAGGEQQWTTSSIRDAADTSGVAQSRDAAVIRLLFLRGGFAEGDTVLGIAVRADVAAVFADRVAGSGGLFADPARIEDAVSVHEAGHLLGLVDLFLSTGRQDPEHPGHSSNPRSVMYWAVESTLVGDVLEGGPPTELDDRDRADLAAIRNG